MIEYDKLKKSLIHLENQYKNYITMNQRDTLSQLDREGISESVVQRFETCYDTLWKHLKKYLEKEAGLPDVPNSPKPVLRMAFENHIIDDIEKWIEYANARTGTAHDYSEQKLKETLDKIENFIKDAVSVYCKMTGEEWPAENNDKN